MDTIADHFGEDILMLDIQEVSPVADYFVIASATSERQLRALVEAVRAVDADGDKPRLEGDPESGWVLVDHGAVVTHLFSAEKRDFYRIEEVWHTARTVVRLQ